jgi:hypothetical protein
MHRQPNIKNYDPKVKVTYNKTLYEVYEMYVDASQTVLI